MSAESQQGTTSETSQETSQEPAAPAAPAQASTPQSSPTQRELEILREGYDIEAQGLILTGLLLVSVPERDRIKEPFLSDGLKFGHMVAAWQKKAEARVDALIAEADTIVSKRAKQQVQAAKTVVNVVGTQK